MAGVLVVSQYEKTFWGNRNVLYLDCGVYVGVYVCQSSSKCTLKMSAIYFMLIIKLIFFFLKQSGEQTQALSDLHSGLHNSLPHYFFNFIFHMPHIQNNLQIQIGL